MTKDDDSRNMVHIKGPYWLFCGCCFKDKEIYYLVGARLLVDTVNEHNLNGLDVKVTIPRLNLIDKCLPQSFFCAWERQAKFATPSGLHQDVHDLHDGMM